MQKFQKTFLMKINVNESENSALKKGSKFNIPYDLKKECNFDKIINNLPNPNGNDIRKKKDKFKLKEICKFIIFKYYSYKNDREFSKRLNQKYH